MLSYSAYNRHQSPSVCSVSSLTSPNTSAAPHEVGEVALDEQEYNGHNVLHNDGFSASVDSDGYEETSDEEELEIIDENEECGYESIIGSDGNVHEVDVVSENSTQPKEVQPNTLSIIQYVCYIVSFFQLCYKLSDRAITLLLVFLCGRFVLDMSGYSG